jgi:hypothetical protein
MSASIDRLGSVDFSAGAGLGWQGIPGARPGWQELSEHFPDDRDCLASFLVLEVAEVLQGAKPANLVAIANKRRPCGRNLYLLWKEHGAALLAESGLQVRELADRGSSLLLLLYRPEALAALLQMKSVSVILKKSGYDAPADPEKVLAELEKRVAGEGFPHEIGVFLGYPLKDVVGFMGLARLSFTCQGPWKIFGDPSQSLSLARNHRECRCRMSQQLASGCNPHDCLKGAALPGISGTPATGFFFAS